MSQTSVLAVVSVCSLFALTIPSHAQQSCVPINQLPVTIIKAGNYCLTQSFVTLQTSGAVISIQASDVHLNLNGFLLDGSAAGAASTANAIFYDSRERGLRVSNGRIRGFDAAITSGVYASNPNATTFEDLRIESSRNFALNVVGDHSLVRRVVIDGVSPRIGQTGASGILGMGNRMRFIDIELSGVTEATNGTGVAISCAACDGTIFEGNRIAGGVGGGMFTAIFAGSNAIVRRNSITNADRGVMFSATGSKYQDNLTTSVSTPFSGMATDAGGNN